MKCTVTPHKSLNTSKGIVRCPALSKQSCEHILEFMGEQGVTDVCRINVHLDGVLKPTNTFVFTFDSPVLPANVKIGFIQAKFDVYIHNPLRCYKCQVFDHHENKCADKRYASTAVCLNIANLVNVKDLPNVPTAQVFILLTQKNARNGRKILKIKCENNLSFPEARKQFEQFYQARTYASAVKPGTCNKSTQTEDKCTQTDDSITEYTREKTSTQTQDTQKEKNPRKKYFLLTSRTSS